MKIIQFSKFCFTPGLKHVFTHEIHFEMIIHCTRIIARRSYKKNTITAQNEIEPPNSFHSFKLEMNEL